jgi:hypothetical protein
VFPARYELNSYIVFRKRLVSRRLNPKFTEEVHKKVAPTSQEAKNLSIKTIKRPLLLRKLNGAYFTNHMKPKNTTFEKNSEL